MEITSPVLETQLPLRGNVSRSKRGTVVCGWDIKLYQRRSCPCGGCECQVTVPSCVLCGTRWRPALMKPNVSKGTFALREAFHTLRLLQCSFGRRLCLPPGCWFVFLKLWVSCPRARRRRHSKSAGSHGVIRFGDPRAFLQGVCSAHEGCMTKTT